ncbi:DNA methyltransferase [Oceanobacillus salinisoli]|uniref:DNA methyltransferase n=1 Tax=Oceanobacillus salinisoli TaxID=2678611 RepID=UPI0018CC5434|nr:DNA methyltransferase [Oceanobacillus salinisoli]
MSNPKRNYNTKNCKENWFDYYAGYSPEFVEDTIKYLNLPSNSIILDPWNGIGTTTQVVEELGYRAIGYDINPVMVIVAKAKRIDYISLVNAEKESNELINKGKSYYLTDEHVQTDPLGVWLNPCSILPFRKLERAILEKNEIHDKKKLQVKNYENISNEVAFYYLALFKTIKELLSVFRSSNPTWVKRPKLASERINVNESIVYESFLNNISKMASSVDLESPNLINKKNNDIILSVSTSESLPLPNDSVDAIIASPPYCTRIDYAIATVLELALLGFSSDEYFSTLRNKMIGTPTISKEEIVVKNEWGKTANYFLKLVSEHESKASLSYYYKIYLQYFNSMYRSLKEINRVMKKGSHCVLVVQDSYYKDILIDLSAVFSEMVEEVSWKIENKISYHNKRTLASIHQGTKKYRKNSSVKETALIFQKKE